MPTIHRAAGEEASKCFLSLQGSRQNGDSSMCTYRIPPLSQSIEELSSEREREARIKKGKGGKCGINSRAVFSMLPGGLLVKLIYRDRRLVLLFCTCALSLSLLKIYTLIHNARLSICVSICAIFCILHFAVRYTTLAMIK